MKDVVACLLCVVVSLLGCGDVSFQSDFDDSSTSELDENDGTDISSEPESGEVALAQSELQLSDPGECDQFLSPDGSRDTVCNYCGDGICDRASENSLSCPTDCTYCGDGVCNGYETTGTCSADCGSRCGDGTCSGSENRDSCWDDCGPKLRRVTVERVRHCRNNWPCNSRVSHPEYDVWDNNGVNKRRQKKTFLSRASNPPRIDVKHLVFIAAGQQFGSGIHSRLTGQSNDWKNIFDKTEMDDYIYPVSYSLVRRLVENDHSGWANREPSETFIGLAMDARFNWEYSSNNKDEIENAYFDWLRSKYYSWNLDSIYLAGHSRGGCLVLRLAQRFTALHPNIPVVVSVFDPVCSADQVELGTNGFFRLDNPVMDGNEFANGTSFGAAFPNTNNLRIFNQVAGASFLDWAAFLVANFSIRAIAQLPFLTGVNTSGSRVTIGDWYEQQWLDTSHNGAASYTGPALRHLQDSCMELGC